MIVNIKNNNKLSARKISIIVFVIIMLLYILMMVNTFNHISNQTYNITIATLDSNYYKVIKSETLAKHPDVYIDLDSFLQQSVHNIVYVTNNKSSKQVILSSVINGTMIATRIPYNNTLYNSKNSLIISEKIEMYIIKDGQYYVIGIYQTIEKVYSKLITSIILVLIFMLITLIIYWKNDKIPVNIIGISLFVKSIIVTVCIVLKYYGNVIFIILTILYIIDVFIYEYYNT